MTPEQAIRLEALRLADPQIANPDMALWIERATKLESYITGVGQSSAEAQQKPAMLPIPEARTNSRVKSPASK